MEWECDIHRTHSTHALLARTHCTHSSDAFIARLIARTHVMHSLHALIAPTHHTHSLSSPQLYWNSSQQQQPAAAGPGLAQPAWFALDPGSSDSKD